MYASAQQTTAAGATTSALLNPAFGATTEVVSNINSSYNAMTVEFQNRTYKLVQFDAHYTWGKALSYTGGDTGAGFSGDSFGAVQEFFNYRPDRGPSAGDTTHRFTADWVYDLPGLDSASAPVAEMLRTVPL